MYLKQLEVENFRKYQHLKVEFSQGMNVLVGENDSGKTAIIDAIRYLLNTKSYESIRYNETDFFQESENNRKESFEIVGILSGFKDSEAASFLEWGYFNSEKEFELRLQLKVNLQKYNRITWDLKAGPENAETQMDGNARDLLKVTYLKPLRDAETELTSGYRSRLAQILQSHKDFQKEKKGSEDDTKHPLEEIVRVANDKIKEHLDNTSTNSQVDSRNIIEQVNEYIDSFKQHNDKRSATLKIADPELSKILRSLGLELENNGSGLGTLNKLFMAAELLHLETDPYNSIRLCLIEELEAHLHPQAQLRVINTLKEISEKQNTQFILTSHSTTLGSSIDLQDLILCKDNCVYPMREDKTKLAKGDYKFLQRFLDSTKANLFFARGVIMVEGDAENILVPTIAEIIGKPLYKHGVSIVNVGSTAFQRYANIFMRKDGNQLNIPVAVITDLDVRAIEYYNGNQDKNFPEYYKMQEEIITVGTETYDVKSINGNIYSTKDELKDAIKSVLKKEKMPDGVNKIINDWKLELDEGSIASVRNAKRKTIQSKFTAPVKAFINEKWTLEYDIALSKNFREDFAKAVEIAKKIKASESYFNNIYDKNGNFIIPKAEDSEESIEELVEKICSHRSDLEVAYKIFQPFVSGNKPSKAVTAQIFSELLIQNKEGLKDNIENDEYLKYIVDAIKYACGD